MNPRTNVAGPISIARPRTPLRLAGRMLALLTEHRYLIWQLTRREVQSRYRGSWLGLLWSLLNPLLMLALYTFVFSVVFRARWGGSGADGNLDFALAVFSGLIAYNLFAESVTAAPSLVLSNTNYVKRVVFPLEVLPVARFLSCAVQAGFSSLILAAVLFWHRGSLPWTLVLLPLALAPLALLTLGVSWFLASLGVFIRDIGNLVSVLTTSLLFLSPVFYPLSKLPEPLQPYLILNPLAPIVDNFRRVIFDGLPPDWGSWMTVTLLSGVLAAAGFAWFVRSKNAFADVL
jgi:lipopolysaccharide transport system permease protein